jgi:hypothetical protein
MYMLLQTVVCGIAACCLDGEAKRVAPTRETHPGRWQGIQRSSHGLFHFLLQQCTGLGEVRIW